MLEELLKKCFDEETTTDKNAENIKTAVLSRIEEEKPMKRFTIKPLIIAAAITATGALSLVTANAATDGAVMEGITKTFSFILNGEEMEGTVTEYTVGDDGKVAEIDIELPDNAAANGITITIEGDDVDGMTILNSDKLAFTNYGEKGSPIIDYFSEYGDGIATYRGSITEAH